MKILKDRKTFLNSIGNDPTLTAKSFGLAVKRLASEGIPVELVNDDDRQTTFNVGSKRVVIQKETFFMAQGAKLASGVRATKGSEGEVE